MKAVIEQLMMDEKLEGLHITPARILKTAITESDEVRGFLAKYGSDTKAFEKSLTQIITKFEADMRVDYGRRTRVRVAPIVQPSVNHVMELAERKTLEKHGPQAEVDFASFLYATIKYHNDGEQDPVIIEKLVDSKFDIDQFLKDFENPASKGGVIEELCTNFNELARSGKLDAVIGREDETLEVIEILCKRKKNNVALVGPAGVGKTAVAEGIALDIVNKRVPKQLENAIVFNLQMGDMVAGTQYRGQFEEKLMNLLKEFKAMEDSGLMPILFIDEMHSVMGAGATGSGGMDFANIIKPALSRGELRCIGATTSDEWHKFIARDKALKRRFQQVEVTEPTRTQTIEILRGAKKHYEDKHKVTYSDAAIVRMVDLSTEFMNDSAQPDKALDIMDFTGSVFKLKGETEIEEPQVEVAVARRAKLSVESVRIKKHGEEQKPMGPTIKEKLFGQDVAVNEVVKIVERSLAGLQEDNKPIGQFLFVGPTGVGKTELAKLLAENMKAAFFRLDMSEFQEPHSVSKLIGSPPGYVGYDAQGGLQKFMQKNPGRKVILLDEIEKAHPKVYELLLQVMDNAKLTDSQGEPMLFHDTVLLMTSNVGARNATAPSIGFLPKSGAAKIDAKDVNAQFAPEFRGRLNGIVYFNPLSDDLMVKIVKKYITQLNDKKLSTRGVTLKVDEASEKWIVAKEGSAGLGARPLQNAIQRHIGDVLSHEILYGKIKDGKKKVSVTVENDKLKFDFE